MSTTTLSTALRRTPARLALPGGAKALQAPGKPRQRPCGDPVLWIALLRLGWSRLQRPWPLQPAQPRPAR